MPVYNSQQYLREAIDSVLNQNFNEWELLIIDDCSTDNSFFIINEYLQKDKRIKYFKNESNKGQLFSRIVGAKNASSEYTLFLDSDDKFFDGTFSYLFNLLSNNHNFDIVGFNWTRESEQSLIPSDNGVDVELFDKIKIIKYCFDIHCFRSLCNMCIRTSLLVKASYNMDLGQFALLRNGEDFIHLFNIIQNADSFCFIFNYFYFYRDNPTSTSKNKSIQMFLDQVMSHEYVYSNIVNHYISYNSFREKRIDVIASLVFRFIVYCFKHERHISVIKKYMQIIKKTTIYRLFAVNYRYGTKRKRFFMFLFKHRFYLLCVLFSNIFM